jgi:hypothetical protein
MQEKRFQPSHCDGITALQFTAILTLSQMQSIVEIYSQQNTMSRNFQSIQEKISSKPI